MKKRFLSIALIFALTLGLVPASAVCSESGSATITYIKEGKEPAKTPTGITASQPSYFGASDAKISGLTDSMEYSVDGGESWEAVPPGTTELSGLPPGSYMIRIRETENNAPGEAITIIIENGPKDITPPTGSIKVGTSIWKVFLNSITFGFLFKDTQKVTITSYDNVALASVQYYLSAELMTLEQIKEWTDWTDYPGTFYLIPTGTCVVYARLTDTSGNEAYLSTDLLMLLTNKTINTEVTELTSSSAIILINADTELISCCGIKYRKRGEKEWITVSGTSPFIGSCSISITCLAPNTEYEYLVFITDKNGNIYTEDETNAVCLITSGISLPGGETPLPGNAHSFVDVKTTDYFADAVDWALENKITTGVDETHFAPMNITTRAQMVTFLWRASGSPSVSAKMPFTDVVKGSYCYEAVLWGISCGVVKGTSETTFSPDASITRAQAVTFLARMAGVTDEAEGYSHNFTDVDAEEYYNNAVAWAAENEITKGINDYTFAPNSECLRAQVITFLYRYYVK